jgi:type IV pilus assembly protein PilA
MKGRIIMKKTNKKGLALRSANQGFSLVELIIVIAIMAILAAALAPQLMKYIDKSRKSSDDSTAGSIKNSVNAALSDDDVYKECKGGTSEKTTTVTITGGTYAGAGTNLEKALKEKMPDLADPKQSDADQWKIVIKGKKDADGGGFTVDVTAAKSTP